MLPAVLLVLLALRSGAQECTASCGSGGAGDFDPSTLINLHEYPLTSGSSAAPSTSAGSTALPSLIQHCQQQLQQEGAFLLPGFLAPEAVRRLLEELQQAGTVESEKNHTVFQLPPDPALPPQHARNRMVFARIGFVGRTRLPPHSLLVRLYEWEPLRSFLSAVAGETLYPSDDSEGSVYGIINGKQHVTTWHFDQSPFSIVLMLQPAEQGGEFQWVPHLRAAPEEALYAGIDAVLERRAILRSINPPAGSVFFFQGSESLHQSAEVFSSAPRITAVFTYADTPGFRNSELVRSQNWKA